MKVVTKSQLTSFLLWTSKLDDSDVITEIIVNVKNVTIKGTSYTDGVQKEINLVVPSEDVATNVSESFDDQKIILR